MESPCRSFIAPETSLTLPYRPRRERLPAWRCTRLSEPVTASAVSETWSTTDKNLRRSAGWACTSKYLNLSPPADTVRTKVSTVLPFLRSTGFADTPWKFLCGTFRQASGMGPVLAYSSWLQRSYALSGSCGRGMRTTFCRTGRGGKGEGGMSGGLGLGGRVGGND